MKALGLYLTGADAQMSVTEVTVTVRNAARANAEWLALCSWF
jgi:hypothetical protein